MTSLNQQFAARIRSAIRECYRIGYQPHRFEQMLDSTDAVTLATSLVKSGDLQDGLKKLKRLGRLDLAMESIMLEPDFEDLFSEDLRAAARWRLEQL